MSQAAVPAQLFGVPADGKKVRWTAYDVYRVTNGKISEEWAGDDHDPDRSLQPSVGCLTSPHQRPTGFGPGAVRRLRTAPADCARTPQPGRRPERQRTLRERKR